MAEKGKQVNILVGLGLSKDSEQNKQKLIKSVNDIGNATQKQNQQFQNTGKVVSQTGNQVSQFSNVVQDTSSGLYITRGSLKNLNKSITDVSDSSEQGSKKIETLGQKQEKTAQSSKKMDEGLNSVNEKLDKTKPKLDKVGANLTMLAWHLRFLGNIFTQASNVMIRSMVDWIKVGAELQDRFFGLSASVSVFGMDSDEARKAVENLATTGLVPLTTATEAYNNILLTGAFTIDEATDFMKHFLDVSTLVTAGQDEMAKSLEFLTKSMLRGTMVLGTDVVTRAIWNMAEERSIKTMGKSLSKLSARNRAIQIATTLQENFNDILGIHEVRMNLIGATITKMTARYQALKLQLAEALWPVVIAISDAFVKFVNIISKLLDELGPLAPALMVATVALTALSGALLTASAVAIGAKKIFGHLVAEFALTTPKLFVLYAAVTAISWAWLYFSGSTKKATDSQKLLNDEVSKMTELIFEQSSLLGGETGDDGGDAAKSRKRQHDRALEDLEEQLKRERSKGLWADQLKIKDLEKRIKREKEDYDTYLDERKGQTGAEQSEVENMYDKMTKETEVATKKMSDYWDGFKGKVMSVSDFVLDRFDEWRKKWDELGIVGKGVLLGITAVIGSTFIGLGIMGAVSAVGGLIKAIGLIGAAITAAAGTVTILTGAIAAITFSAAIASAWELSNEIDNVYERINKLRSQEDQMRQKAMDAYHRGDFDEYRRWMDLIQKSNKSIEEIQGGLPGHLPIVNWYKNLGRPASSGGDGHAT
jgi:hypothetical protein